MDLSVKSKIWILQNIDGFVHKKSGVLQIFKGLPVDGKSDEFIGSADLPVNRSSGLLGGSKDLTIDGKSSWFN